jgi:hypothetical protein
MTDKAFLKYLVEENELNSENNLKIILGFYGDIQKDLSFSNTFINEGGITKIINFLVKYDDDLETRELEALFNTLKLLTTKDEAIQQFSKITGEDSAKLVGLFYPNFNNQVLIYGFCYLIK